MKLGLRHILLFVGAPIPIFPPRIPNDKDHWAMKNPEHARDQIIGTMVTIEGPTESILCGTITTARDDPFSVEDQTYVVWCPADVHGEAAVGLMIYDATPGERDNGNIVMNVAEIVVMFMLSGMLELLWDEGAVTKGAIGITGLRDGIS